MIYIMHRSIFYSTLLYFLLVECKDVSQENNSSSLPELANCDSAAVMYYHTADNPRFFNILKLYDKEQMSAIANDINDEIIPGRDTCSTQGKIYYYGKGDAVYVAYFSRAKDCMMFSFIKTGEKYFVSMSDRTKELLDELEKLAKEPIITGPLKQQPLEKN